MANLSVEAVVLAGLARGQEYAANFPAVRSVLYRRVSIRQQELAAMAAKVNRDYFGVAADAVVTDGAADINDIVTPVPTPEFIHLIEVAAVADEATTAAVGDSVSIVRLDDVTAEEAPRVTIRSGIIRHVGADLAEVTSLKVYYSRIPDALLPTEDGTTLVAIPSPYDELLVLDLAELIVDRTLRGTPDDKTKAVAMQALGGEVKEWEGKWLAHVAGYGVARTRFAR